MESVLWTSGVFWWTWVCFHGLMHLGACGFTWLHPVSLGCTWGHSGSLRCNWVHSGSLGVTRVHSASFGCTWVHSGSLGYAFLLSLIAPKYLGFSPHDSGSLGCACPVRRSIFSPFQEIKSPLGFTWIHFFRQKQVFHEVALM